MSTPVKIFTLIIGLTISSLGLAQGQQGATLQQQLYMEMMQANQQIQQLQQQAFNQNIDLAEQRDELIAMIDDRMVELDPAAEALIEERDELVAQLQAATPGEQNDAIQQAGAAYQSVVQELQAVQQQAMQNPAIQQMQAEVQEAAIATMQEINPEVDAMISRFNEIRTELMQMQQSQ